MAEDSSIAGIPVDDLRLISVAMDSNYTSENLSGTKSTVGFRIGDRDVSNHGGTHSLGISLSVSMDTTADLTSEKVLSANVKVGCSVHATSGETDEDLEDAAIEACVGYARTIIMSLASSSVANLRLSFPYVSAAEVRAMQETSKD